MILIIFFVEGVVGDTTTLDSNIVLALPTKIIIILSSAISVMSGGILGLFIGDGTIALDSGTMRLIASTLGSGIILESFNIIFLVFTFSVVIYYL